MTSVREPVLSRDGFVIARSLVIVASGTLSNPSGHCGRGGATGRSPTGPTLSCEPQPLCHNEMFTD
jgi:hypothetical protein